jgi:hypothetical protein
MPTDAEDFDQFIGQRQAAAAAYVSGNPDPLGRLVAQELPATFFGVASWEVVYEFRVAERGVVT